MKILIINSSYRENGATGKVLNEISNELKDYSDVEINFINLSNYKIEYCKGCSRCFETGICYIKDDAENISLQISQSDAIIIGSPTYASSVPGQLKTLIDRGHFVMEQLLYNKYTLPVVTYENAGGSAVIKFLNKLFLYSGGILCGKLCSKVKFNQDPLENAMLQKRIKKISKHFYNSVTNQKRGSVVNRIKHYIVYHIGIKPFVLKQEKRYSGVVEHWNERGL